MYAPKHFFSCFRSRELNVSNVAHIWNLKEIKKKVSKWRFLSDLDYGQKTSGILRAYKLDCGKFGAFFGDDV